VCWPWAVSLSWSHFKVLPFICHDFILVPQE
jgi:hypothetical protein